jgi:hypothetical protein
MPGTATVARAKAPEPSNDYGRQCDMLDMEIAVQHHVRELPELGFTLAQAEALSHLTCISMRNATVLERCRRAAAILNALAKHENGKPAAKMSERQAMRIAAAVEAAAFGARAEYADWHAFIDSAEGRTASRPEIENLARMRDAMAEHGRVPDPGLYNRLLAVFRTADSTGARS